MLRENIVNLRNRYGYSQEEIAEKIGISRQAYSKWEQGETVPDIEKCASLAKIYNITLDALYETVSDLPEDFEDREKILPAPKGKHLFGTVTMNEKGQIVIPKKAREIMGYENGVQLLVLGDEGAGLALMKASDFIAGLENTIKEIKNNK